MNFPNTTEKDVHFDQVKAYIRTQIVLLKLESVEKLSRILSSVILVLVMVILSLSALFYLSAAFIMWSASVFGGFLPGILIMCGGFLLLALILYLFRVKLILNPFIRLFSKILFDNETNKEA